MSIKVCGIPLKRTKLPSNDALEEYLCEGNPAISMRKHKLGFGPKHWWALEFVGFGVEVLATPNLESPQNAALFLEHQVAAELKQARRFLEWVMQYHE